MSINKESEDEPIRIGVFVCHCGTNIGGVLDCEELAEYAATLPNVVFSDHNLYTCAEIGLTTIKEAIEEHNLNRVIVCSCTPRTHEPLFRSICEEAGLNKYLFSFVNIREQCSWVHMKKPEDAFEKAKDLIKMGVARATKLEALETIVVDVDPSALVIGGGISGMNAASNLSKQGFKTYLVEKEKNLGGLLNSLYRLFPNDQESSELLKDIEGRIQADKNITVYTSSMITSIDGFVGNFEVEINQNGNSIRIKVGAIIVAVGATPLKPINLFGYDGKIRITQFELENVLKNYSLNTNNIVMIQCVGTRNEERMYCSNFCCMSALKNALIIKEKNPDAHIAILFRDMHTPGIAYEEYYRRARESGIIFIKYLPEKPPIVEENKIKIYNEYLGTEIIIPYELLVLSTPLIANEDNKQIAQLLKVQLEENNFFLEAHVKLRPNDFATDGVYIAGSAKWPVDITESISQGYAAAARASTILSHDTLEVEGAIAYLPEEYKDLCRGCEICLKLCPYKAIRKNEKDEIEIIQVLCKGCGVCVASCPKKAIKIKHYTNEQILSEIYAFGGIKLP